MIEPQHVLDLEIRQCISRHALQHVRCTTYFDHMLDGIVLQLKKAVHGTEMERETVSTVQVPASWWQHWKRDCAPRWFRRRFPVKTRTIETKVVRKFVDAH